MIGATKGGASAKRLTELVSRFVSHILNQSYKISAEKGQLCLDKGKPRTAVVQCLFTRTQSKTAGMAIQGYELNDRHAAHMGNVIGAAMRTASAAAQSSSSQPDLGAALCLNVWKNTHFLQHVCFGQICTSSDFF